MTYRNGILTGVIGTLVVVGAGVAAGRLALSGSRTTSKSDSQPAPATVATPLKEETINVITLSDEAVKKLALGTAMVERKPVQRARIYGGDIVVPPGRSALVAAPLAGSLRATPAGVPRPGLAVKKGQVVLELLPLLTPEGRANLTASKIEADGLVKNAVTTLELARIALERARNVFEKGGGSKKAVDEAQAQYDMAQKTLEAVSARRDLLERVVGEVERGTAGPIAVEAPQDGLLRSLSALPGQVVAAGAPLFEVADLTEVWVRVPVPVGDRADVVADAQATIGGLGGRLGGPSRTGKPVAAPPSADPAAATVDLFYELDNTDARHSPGQRVGVTVSLRSDAESLVVPWSAVVHDIYGGTWVYVQLAERTFERRRVVVRYVRDASAVLAAGPAKGTRVVTDGAAELFGTEVGFTK